MSPKTDVQHAPIHSRTSDWKTCRQVNWNAACWGKVLLQWQTLQAWPSLSANAEQQELPRMQSCPFETLLQSRNHERRSGRHVGPCLTRCPSRSSDRICKNAHTYRGTSPRCDRARAGLPSSQDEANRASLRMGTICLANGHLRPLHGQGMVV